MIVAALHARKAKGTPPFTVLSCDNLEGNGKVARTVVACVVRNKCGLLTAHVVEAVQLD